MARTDFQLNIRVPHKDMDFIREQAKKGRRSITSQMQIVIEEYREREEMKSATVVGAHS